MRKVIVVVIIMLSSVLYADTIDGSSIDRYYSSVLRIEEALRRDERIRFIASYTRVNRFFQTQQVISDREDFELVDATFYFLDGKTADEVIAVGDLLLEMEQAILLGQVQKEKRKFLKMEKCEVQSDQTKGQDVNETRNNVLNPSTPKKDLKPKDD